MGTQLTAKQIKELREEYAKIPKHSSEKLSWCIARANKYKMSYGRFIHQLKI